MFITFGRSSRLIVSISKRQQGLSQAFVWGPDDIAKKQDYKKNNTVKL